MNNLLDITSLISSENWSAKAEFTWNIYRWICFIGDLASIPIIIIVLAIIICARKRKEAILILIPVFFLISCIFDALRVVYEKHPYFDYFVAVDYFGYFMGHWMFSVHYLKTSLIIPRLLKEAKLEWLMKDAERESREIGWNFSKLQDEIPINNANLVGCSF